MNTCERGNGPAGSIQGGECVQQMRDRQALR
jgi:hypothetical protein